MKKEEIAEFISLFDEIKYQGIGENKTEIEFWYARDLQKLLEYSDWRNFISVVNKAKESCEASKYKHHDHFVEVNKMVGIGLDTERKVDDIMLTRYACYLIAQNGDPKKQAIAFAQSYFAIQTRKQEILEKRIELAERLQAREKLIATETELLGTIYERGIDN